MIMQYVLGYTLTGHWNPLGISSYWQHTSQSCAHSESRLGAIAFSFIEVNVQTKSMMRQILSH